MKAAFGAVLSAIAASACCLGPVFGLVAGSGALSAAMWLEPYRPLLLVLTAALLGLAFAAAYRPTCRSGSPSRSRVLIWMAALTAGLFALFPLV